MSDCLLCLHPLGTSPVLSLNKPSVWFCATHQKHLVNGKCPDAKDPRDARIAELEAALQRIASLPTRDANGQKDRASIDVLTGGDAIRIARAALSTKEDGT